MRPRAKWLALSRESRERYLAARLAAATERAIFRRESGVVGSALQPGADGTNCIVMFWHFATHDDLSQLTRTLESADIAEYFEFSLFGAVEDVDQATIFKPFLDV
jgi:hypothetical protein